MLSHKFLPLIFLFAACAVQAQWSTATLSEARERPYPVASGSKALFVLGAIGNTGQGNKVDIYDSNTGTWTVHDLPFSSESTNPDPPFAEKDGKVYILDVEHFSDIVQVYDAVEDNWTTLTLSQARAYVSIGTAGDYIVFAGGATSQNDASDKVELYNVKTGAWHYLHLSEPRAFISITGLGNKIFLAGGFTPTQISDRIDIFDTESFTRNTKYMMRPRGMTEALAVGNKVLIAGGGVFDVIEYNEVDIYDAETDTWSSHTLTQHDFSGLMEGYAVGHKAYFQGGIGANVLDIYDADLGVWSTEEIPTQHGLGAFIRAGSKLYLAGGVNDPVGVVEVFDCNTATWDTLGYLSTPRYWVSGAIAGNKLLFAGGYGSGYSNLVDIYTGISSNNAAMPVYPLSRMYPNPTRNLLEVELPDDAQTLRLFDNYGRLVWMETAINTRHKSLNMNHLRPGIYQVTVEGKSSVYVGKIVRE